MKFVSNKSKEEINQQPLEIKDDLLKRQLEAEARALERQK